MGAAEYFLLLFLFGAVLGVGINEIVIPMLVNKWGDKFIKFVERRIEKDKET